MSENLLLTELYYAKLCFFQAVSEKIETLLITEDSQNVVLLRGDHLPDDLDDVEIVSIAIYCDYKTNTFEIYVDFIDDDTSHLVFRFNPNNSLATAMVDPEEIDDVLYALNFYLTRLETASEGEYVKQDIEYYQLLTKKV